MYFTEYAAHRIDQENRLNAWLCLQEMQGKQVQVVPAYELQGKKPARGEQWFLPTDLGGGLVKNWCSRITEIDYNFWARLHWMHSYCITATDSIYVTQTTPRPIQTGAYKLMHGQRVCFIDFDTEVYGTVQDLPEGRVRIKCDNGRLRTLNKGSVHLFYGPQTRNSENRYPLRKNM